MFEGSAEFRRVVALAGEEASRVGHRYVGPEHLLVGMLREDRSGAARVLRAEGVDLEAARAALGRLAAQEVVPDPRPSDAELLSSLGIELDAVRRDAEQAFGIQRLGWAIREATRARRRGVGRVARTPLEGPPMLAAHAFMLARERATALGHEAVGSELLLLGVLDDVTTRPPRCMSNRWVRRLHASVGLPGAIGARSGRCWPPWAWTLSVCVLLRWRRLGRRWPSRRMRDKGCPAMSSGSEASKVFGRFTEQAHQILDLGRDEAERIGHRYLGPEHVLLGVLRESASEAARLLRAHGIGLAAARAELLALAELGVVPTARPSDRALLGTLGVDLEEIRRTTERTFGATALGEATWRVTRRRGWRGARVVWTPLCGPPFFAKRALQLAGERASALGHDEVGPELLLLGVVEDAREPAGSPRGSRRHRRIIAHVGLPDSYQGAAGPLLAALGVDREALRRAVLAALGEGRS